MVCEGLKPNAASSEILGIGLWVAATVLSSVRNEFRLKIRGHWLVTAQKLSYNGFWHNDLSKGRDWMLVIEKVMMIVQICLLSRLATLRSLINWSITQVVPYELGSRRPDQAMWLPDIAWSPWSVDVHRIGFSPYAFHNQENIRNHLRWMNIFSDILPTSCQTDKSSFAFGCMSAICEIVTNLLHMAIWFYA